jgi:Phosphotransferase enzyme family
VAEGAAGLAASLIDRLHGLAPAMDESRAALLLGQALLTDGVRVEDVTVGSVWYRSDGTCTLRYRLRCVGPGSPSAVHVVLGRVFPPGDEAADYVARTVMPLAVSEAGREPPHPWRRWAAAWPDLGLAAHPFPIDPGLPSLPLAMNLSTVMDRGLQAPPDRRLTSVQVVHHSRDGACVLRYDVAPAQTRPPASGPAHIYGKVYRDSTGATVDRFLRDRSQGHRSTRSSARLPPPVGYVDSLRLLLTDTLPGRPLLPAAIRAAVPTQPGTVPVGSTARLRSMLVAAGCALAALHTGERAPVPRRALGDLFETVDRELEVVARVWPCEARRVEKCLLPLRDRVGRPPTEVLCHGDFTPAQILFEGTEVCGLVDFDTVCRGDPAMDLGRFLAYLDMLAAKVDGRAVGSSFLKEAGSAFLGGYHQRCSADADDAGNRLHRIEIHRALSLARTALHACRQLKQRRLTLALSLLESPHL